MVGIGSSNSLGACLERRRQQEREQQQRRDAELLRRAEQEREQERIYRLLLHSEEAEQQEERRQGGQRSNRVRDPPQVRAQQARQARQAQPGQRQQPPAAAPVPSTPIDAAEEPMPESGRELRELLQRQRAQMRAQQEQIDRMNRHMRAEEDRREEQRRAARTATRTADVQHEANGLSMGGLSNNFIRMFGGGGGGGGAPPVRRHVNGPTMRESEVKGKLARFLAGMRAYERQKQLLVRQNYGGGSGEAAQQAALPPVLSEFITWAGDVLANDSGSGDSGRAGRGNGGPNNIEEAAREYVGGCTGVGATAARAEDVEEHEENCCICLSALQDASLFDELGEPLETACGHRFHAVCFAQHLEASEQDVWCPMCRSTNLGVRFL